MWTAKEGNQQLPGGGYLTVWNVEGTSISSYLQSVFSLTQILQGDFEFIAFTFETEFTNNARIQREATD